MPKYDLLSAGSFTTPDKTKNYFKGTDGTLTEVVDLSTLTTDQIGFIGHPTAIHKILLADRNISVLDEKKVDRTGYTGSIILPSGTTAQRDGSPVAGYLRWNSTTGSAEVYDGSDWGDVGSGGGSDGNDYVDTASLDGSTLTLGRTGALNDLNVDLSSISAGGYDYKYELTEYTATASQTNFAVTYTTGASGDLVSVFQNGERVDEADFTATSGTEIVLGTGATLDDAIQIVVTSDITKRTSESFQAKGNQTSFMSPLKITSNTVYMNGQKMEKGVEYNYRFGIEIVLGSATTSGDIIDIVGYADSTLTGNVAETIASTSDENQLTGTATVSNYNVEVYKNGIKLKDSDFSYSLKYYYDFIQSLGNGNTMAIIFTYDVNEQESYNNVDRTVEKFRSVPTNSVATTIDKFNKNLFGTAEYHIYSTQGTNFYSTKMLVTHDGNTADFVIYGEIDFGAEIGTFNTIVNGDAIELQYTTNMDDVEIKFTRSLLSRTSKISLEDLPLDLGSGTGTFDLQAGDGVIDLGGSAFEDGGTLDLGGGTGTFDLGSGDGTIDLN